jgi:hypothetical protein
VVDDVVSWKLGENHNAEPAIGDISNWASISGIDITCCSRRTSPRLSLTRFSDYCANAKMPDPALHRPNLKLRIAFSRPSPGS